MKKILISTILISALAVPIIGIAQTELTPVECDIKHDLSDYGPCCVNLGEVGLPAVKTCLGEPGVFDNTKDFQGALQGYVDGSGVPWPSVWPKVFTHCCLIDKILTIGDYIFVAILVVAILVMLFSAWTFLTAAGSPDKVGKARTLLIFGVIGVAVAFLAKVGVKVVAAIMA